MYDWGEPEQAYTYVESGTMVYAQETTANRIATRYSVVLVQWFMYKQT